MKEKFLKYVIPSVLAMWIYSIYTMINGIFVAKGVGEIALAAVNISTPFVNVIFAAAILFAVGTSTIASINLGNKEVTKAREAFTMNAVVLILIGLSLTVAVLVNLEQIAYFMGATKSTILYVKDYLGVLSIFSVFYMLSYYFEVLVKTDGHPHLATIGVCVSAVTIIVLDYVLVIKLGWGVKGAAIATGLSQAAACLIYFMHFLRKGARLKFIKFKFDVSLLKRTLPIGLSDCVTEFSTGFITFMFNRTILQNIGESGIITYTVILYINSIVMMTMAGISQGTQPLISYYYGKGNKETYKYFLKTAIKTTAAISALIYVGCMLFAEQINSIYISHDEAELFSYSVKALRMYALTFLVVGFNIIFTGFYSAIAKPLYSMIISISRGLVVIVLSLMTMTAVFGDNGIWVASVVSEILCLVISGLLFVKFTYNDLFTQNMSRKRIEATDI